MAKTPAPTLFIFKTMPRKRMIDPEFWSDEEIGKWSYRARLFYIGLWNFSDDCGRFKAHSGLLKSQIFPYDDPKSLKIEKIKEEVSNKIVWYQVNGSQYGFIRNFLKHQRIDKPQPSKIPPPPEDKFDEHSTNNPRTLAPNISKENISKENIISPQADGLLKQFSSNLQEKINIYIERNRLKNKSKVITEGRKTTLLTELWNSKERCADETIFSYALEMSLNYDACNIGYINAIIKNKKAGK